MKRETQVAIGIGGIVIVAALVGLGLFLVSGSQLGVAFVVVGIPGLLILGVGAYVRGIVSRSATTETDFATKRARNVADAARDFLADFDRAGERCPGWETEELAANVEQVLADLAAQGVSFDRESRVYSLDSAGRANLQELERIESDVDVLADEVAISLARYVGSAIDRLARQRERLADAGFDADADLPEPPEASDVGGIDESLDAIEAARRSMSSAIVEAIGTVERLIDETDDPVDETRVADLLSGADADRLAGEYASAIDAVIEARSSLESDLSGRFESDRAGIEGVIETVQSSVADEYVDGGTLAPIEEIETEVRSLDTALAVGDLRRLEERLRETAVEVVAELSGTLADDLETLAAAEVPPDYYERPAAADERYVENLRAAGSIEAFRQEWLVAVGELTGALDEVSSKASVVRSYPDAEALIDEEIETTGRVTGADLPIKRPGAFMELYERTHPGVSYDPSVPALTAAAARETYDLTVLARFAAGGPKRELTVSLSGTAHEDTETVRTHLAEEITFGDVPYGEYTVRVTTPVDDYGEASETVTIDGDRSLEITVPEIGLIERVCAGVESAVEQSLEDLSPELGDDFEASGYLSSSMEFPVGGEYVPCLLALWAEREDLAATMAGGDVYVYDASVLEAELSSIVSYELEPGESVSYGAIRDRYLTAPLPDDVLQAAVARLETGDGVETTESGITKDNNGS